MISKKTIQDWPKYKGGFLRLFSGYLPRWGMVSRKKYIKMLTLSSGAVLFL